MEAPPSATLRHSMTGTQGPKADIWSAMTRVGVGTIGSGWQGKPERANQGNAPPRQSPHASEVFPCKRPPRRTEPGRPRRRRAGRRIRSNESGTAEIRSRRSMFIVRSRYRPITLCAAFPNTVLIPHQGYCTPDVCALFSGNQSKKCSPTWTASRRACSTALGRPRRVQVASG